MTPTRHNWTTAEIEALKKPRELAPYTPKYFVDLAKGLDTNDGKSASKPFRTVRKAGQVAVAGDAVEVRGNASGADAFWTPNAGVRFVGVTDAATGKPKISKGFYDGIVFFRDTHKCIIENFDLSKAVAAVELHESTENFFRAVDFHDCGSVKVIHGSKKNRFENFKFWSIGKAADNSTDGLTLLDGAEENEFVRGFVGNSGHAGISSTFQNAEQRPNNRNFFYDITIENEWSGGFILNGTDYNTYAEKIHIKRAAKSPLAAGANTKCGLQVTGWYALLKDFIIEDGAGHGIQILAYVYNDEFGNSIPQIAHGNELLNFVVRRNNGVAVQFGGNHGLVPTSNIIDSSDLRANTGYIGKDHPAYNIQVEQYQEEDSSVYWTLDKNYGNTVKNSIFDAAQKAVNLTQRPNNKIIEKLDAYPSWMGNKTSAVVTTPPPIEPPVPTIPKGTLKLFPLPAKAKVLAEIKRIETTGWLFCSMYGTREGIFEKI